MARTQVRITLPEPFRAVIDPLRLKWNPGLAAVGGEVLPVRVDPEQNHCLTNAGSVQQRKSFPAGALMTRVRESWRWAMGVSGA